uniref:Metalloendopeptidase n=1 Tax=Globodera pallida TaxID=36090 RepID=A0A183C2I2_GLOPA
MPLIILLTFIIVFKANADKLRNRYFDKTLADVEVVLTNEDFQRARRQRRQSDDNFVEHMPPIDDTAMYNQSRFEGDIVNPGLLRSILKNGTDDETVFTSGLQHNAVRYPYLKWSGATIPYTVSQQYLLYGRDQIVQAIDEYSSKTCIKFRPKTIGDMEYIHIFPDDGCYSLVGKVGGKQPVSLGDGCMSRTDRDEYVNVIWENIDQNLRDQFDKYSQNMIDFLGTKYDYGSVMHYGPYAFSKNGRPTIQPKQKGKTIGQRLGFSQNDLYKINKLYACPNTPSMPPADDSAQSSGSPVAASASLSANAGGTPERTAHFWRVLAIASPSSPERSCLSIVRKLVENVMIIVAIPHNAMICNRCANVGPQVASVISLYSNDICKLIVPTHVETVDKQFGIENAINYRIMVQKKNHN